MQKNLVSELISLQGDAPETLLYRLLRNAVSSFWHTGRMGGPYISRSETIKDTLYVSNGRNDNFKHTINLVTYQCANYFVIGHGKENKISDIVTDMKCWISMFDAVSKLTSVYGIDEQRKICQDKRQLTSMLEEKCRNADKIVMNFIQMHKFILKQDLNLKLVTDEYSQYPRFYSDDFKNQIWFDSNGWGMSLQDNSLACSELKQKWLNEQHD